MDGWKIREKTIEKKKSLEVSSQKVWRSLELEQGRFPLFQPDNKTFQLPFQNWGKGCPARNISSKLKEKMESFWPKKLSHWRN